MNPRTTKTIEIVGIMLTENSFFQPINSQPEKQSGTFILLINNKINNSHNDNM
jgi:hypothetical protein